MSTTKQDQISHLKQAIAALEAQRPVLGDAVVETSLAAFRKQLLELEGQTASPQQQRKLATILYADVVASTELSQQLEPDEMLEIMDAALKRLAVPVEKRGGHVTRFQGDGFKVVFGLPKAREDDPEQAVRAGLEILETAEDIAREWKEQLGISSFRVRVGINTGMVAIGGLTEAEDTVMGRAVNLAARIESNAPADGLLISHHTYRHVRGIFKVEEREPILAKGFDQPVEVYLVKQVMPRVNYFLTRGLEGVETRMVGRQTEMDVLQDSLLSTTEERKGQVITIVADAGLGKSRLIYEFQNWLDLLPSSVRVFLGQARLEIQNTPFSLLRDLFAYRFQIQDSDPLDVMREKFEQGMSEIFNSHSTSNFPDDLPHLAQIHLLGQLLGYDFHNSPHLKGYLQDAQALRDRGLQVLEDYFTAVSSSGAVVILLEDVHWADESSLDAIRRLEKEVRTSPLMIVYLTRKQLYDRHSYWGESEQYHTRLDLQALSKADSLQLVKSILKFVDEVPQELIELVVNKAEGNPFYMEELIKVLIEQGVIVKEGVDRQDQERWQVVSERLVQLELPTTLTGVLQARLEALGGEERRLLEQASVVGRVFWNHLLAHLSSYANGRTNHEQQSAAFRVLEEKEMIFQQQVSAIAGAMEYSFKHDLLWEVVYETVLIRDRKRYHDLVADWLIENSGERLGETLGLIGDHLERAGRNEQAIDTFMKAGEWCLTRYANLEAEGYFKRGLALGAVGKVRAQYYSGLGNAVALQGQLSEAHECFMEAISIYKSLDSIEGMVNTYTQAIRWTNTPAESIRLYQECLPISENLEEGPVLARFLIWAGIIAAWQGVEQDAVGYLRRALRIGEKIEDVEIQADTLAIMGQFPTLSTEERLQAAKRSMELAERHKLLEVLGSNLAGLGEFYCLILGKFREAINYKSRNLEIARKRGDLEGELFAIGQVANLRTYLGELKEADLLLEELDNRLDMLPELEWTRNMMVYWRAKYLRQLGDFRLALKTGRQAVNWFKQKGLDSQWATCVVLCILPILLDMDRFLNEPVLDEAEDYLKYLYEFMAGGRLAVRIHELGSVEGLTSILYSRKGDVEQASRWLNERLQQDVKSSAYFERKDILQAEIELALVKKDWDSAMDLFAAYAALVENAEQRWEVARLYLDWGDAYASRRQVEDLDRAEQLYHQALDLFTDMGADGYVKVLEDKLGKLEFERGVS
jgi:class 3 adenylate cyclase/tetratricopeptide (TPR) repeat protein